MRRILGMVLALAAVPAFSPGVRTASAEGALDPALGPLLGKLALHAQSFEEMKKRGSFTANGKIEELDGKGHVDGTKEMVLRVTATPAERLTEIVRYLEDGEDKTDMARKKMAKQKAEKEDTSKKKRDIHLPFLLSEQPHYTFALAERDPAAPGRVRVTFTPREPGEEAYKGSAWVDEPSGQVLTLGFSPTKNPAFVDHVDVTMRFDHATALGRAPSSLTFDARGGLLVIHKHYRGSVAIVDPRLSF